MQRIWHAARALFSQISFCHLSLEKDGLTPPKLVARQGGPRRLPSLDKVNGHIKL